MKDPEILFIWPKHTPTPSIQKWCPKSYYYIIKTALMIGKITGALLYNIRKTMIIIRRVNGIPIPL